MAEQINILVVDDEQIVLDSIRKHLRNEAEYSVTTVTSVAEALEILKSDSTQIVLTDLMMPEIDGLEFIKIVKDINPSILMIMITGYATINTAIQAMQLGAFDYLAKPFTRDELQKVVKRAAEIVSAAIDAAAQKNVNHSSRQDRISSIIGIGQNSWIMREEDGSVTIGIERPFLYSIGRIQSVYLPSVGDVILHGSVFFQVFSADLRSQTLLSPLSGTVIAVNYDVLANPNQALQDPYETGWLIRIEPSAFEDEIKLMGR
jgi:CheY-like chemotaxis protein/glycine cleavage system H lipoate-binding protein